MQTAHSRWQQLCLATKSSPLRLSWSTLLIAASVAACCSCWTFNVAELQVQLSKLTSFGRVLINVQYDNGRPSARVGSDERPTCSKMAREQCYAAGLSDAVTAGGAARRRVACCTCSLYCFVFHRRLSPPTVPSVNFEQRRSRSHDSLVYIYNTNSYASREFPSPIWPITCLVRY